MQYLFYIFIINLLYKPFSLLLFLGASGGLVTDLNKMTLKFLGSEGSMKEPFSENEESSSINENSKSKRIGQIVQRFSSTLRKTFSSLSEFVRLIHTFCKLRLNLVIGILKFCLFQEKQMSSKIRDLEESLELLSDDGPNQRSSGRPQPHRPEGSSQSSSASRLPSAAQSALSEPGQRRDSSDSDLRSDMRNSVRASRSTPLNSALQPSGNCSCALVVHDFLGDLSREFETLSKLCSFPSSFLQGYTQLTASKPGILLFCCV